MDRHIDYKYETWGRYYLPEGMTREDAINFVKNTKYGWCIHEELLKYDPEAREFTFEQLDEAENPLSPEENEGFSTIEYWEDDKLIAQNGKGYPTNESLGDGINS